MIYSALRKRNKYYVRKIYTKYNYSDFTNSYYYGINFGYLFRYYFYCDIYTNQSESFLISYDGNRFNSRNINLASFLYEILNLIISMPMGYFEFIEFKNDMNITH